MYDARLIKSISDRRRPGEGYRHAEVMNWHKLLVGNRKRERRRANAIDLSSIRYSTSVSADDSLCTPSTP